MAGRYWLVKSEPGAYSIEDLKRDRRTVWDGVRNFQARNFLRDQMKAGDLVFFYHSNAEPSGIAGVAQVVRAGYPDPSAFDPKDKHYDPKSKRGNPSWFVVDIEFVKKFEELIPLETLRGAKGLEQMPLLERGQRLSVQPVSPQEWAVITGLARRSKKKTVPAGLA